MEFIAEYFVKLLIATWFCIASNTEIFIEICKIIAVSSAWIGGLIYFIWSNEKRKAKAHVRA